MILRSLSLFLALEIGMHGVAWACSCAAPDSVEASFTDSDLVVLAEVLSVREPLSLGCTVSSADPMSVRLEVIEGFAGAEAGDVVTVTTARDGASCGVSFRAGESWVVYARDGQVGVCGRTRLATADDPELDVLADLASVTAPE